MGTGKEMVENLNNRDNKNDRDSKDYLAVGVFVAVLLIFIVSFSYLIHTTKKGAFANPVEFVFKWMKDCWNKGKHLVQEKRDTWSQHKSDREVKRHLDTGYKLYKRRIYRKALQEFDKTIEMDSKNFKAYFWRGRVYLKSGQYDKAISDFKIVIKLKADYAEAYDNLGWLYYQREEYDESIKYLSKSIELKPNNGWAYYTRGRNYFHKGDLPHALEDIELSCNLGYKRGCEVYKKYKNGSNSD